MPPRLSCLAKAGHSLAKLPSMATPKKRATFASPRFIPQPSRPDTVMAPASPSRMDIPPGSNINMSARIPAPKPLIQETLTSVGLGTDTWSHEKSNLFQNEDLRPSNPILSRPVFNSHRVHCRAAARRRPDGAPEPAGPIKPASLSHRQET